MPGCQQSAIAPGAVSLPVTPSGKAVHLQRTSTTLGIHLQGIDYQQGLQWDTEAPQNLESDAGIFVRSSQMTCAELRKCGRSWATFGVAARLHLAASFFGLTVYSSVVFLHHAET